MADTLTYEDRPYVPIDAEDAAEVAIGLAEADAGQVISNEAMGRWIRLLGFKATMAHFDHSSVIVATETHL